MDTRTETQGVNRRDFGKILAATGLSAALLSEVAHAQGPARDWLLVRQKLNGNTTPQQLKAYRDDVKLVLYWIENIGGKNRTRFRSRLRSGNRGKSDLKRQGRKRRPQNAQTANLEFVHLISFDNKDTYAELQQSLVSSGPDAGKNIWEVDQDFQGVMLAVKRLSYDGTPPEPTYPDPYPPDPNLAGKPVPTPYTIIENDWIWVT